MFFTFFKALFNKESIYTDNVADFVVDIFKSFKNNPHAWTIIRSDNNFPEISKGNTIVDFRWVVDTVNTVTVEVSHKKYGSSFFTRLSIDDEKYLIKYLLPLVKDFISGAYDIKQSISAEMKD
tara:strand:- start:1285 stop:1653 length:369 start_codon:yes stop_codon:yes gene_type:complete